MIKRLFSLLLACLFVLLPFASCAKKETPETRVVNCRGCNEWNGRTIGSESFEFLESAATGYYGRSTKQKGTAVRITLTDEKTGESRCICLDPLCYHDVASGCPAATRYPVSNYYVVGDVLFYLCQGNTWHGNGLGPSSGTSAGDLHSELRFYNLSTGDYGTVFEVDDSQTRYALIGDRYVFYVIADVEDGEIVYKFERFDYLKGTYLTCGVFEKEYVVTFMTDARVYIASSSISVHDPADLEYLSFDYEGGDRREESYVLSGLTMSQGTTLVCRKYAPFPGGIGLLETPYYYFYNLTTREYREFPENEPANMIGYRESDGRYYYLTSERSDLLWSANPYMRSAELGMTYAEFAKSEEMQRMYEERDEYMFNRKTYLRSCDASGGDVKTHFEFPEGTFFCPPTGLTYDNERIPLSGTGYVSADGLWILAESITLGEKGRWITTDVRINLETGEIEELGSPDPGLPF